MKKPTPQPSVAELYHQETSYFPWNIASFAPDPSARPKLFKDYLSEGPVDLKRLQQSSRSRSQRSAANLANRVARILHWTGGITSIRESAEGPVYFRAAPSAGGLYPTEIYLACRQVPGLPNGIHAYSPLKNHLVPLWEGDFGLDLEELCFHHAAAIRARAFLLFTGSFQKSAWRYQERAYRRILLDTGHQLGNAVTYAAEEGLRGVAVLGFYDSAFNNLLFLDPRQEVLLGVVPLLDEAEASSTRINSPFACPSSSESYEGSSAWEDGVMRLLHRRSEIVASESLLSRVPKSPLAAPFGARVNDAESVFLDQQREVGISGLADVIRQRRSTRRFAGESISLHALERVLRYGFEPAVRYWLSPAPMHLAQCALADPTLLDTYVLSLRVDGLKPGAYAFNPLENSLNLVQAGQFDAQLRTLCLYQDLGRDCAAAIVHTANLPAAVERYGNRAYRYLHLDAGHLGQRFNLAAIASGIGVSGIGGFFDAEVNRLLGLGASTITVYITVVGQPG